MNFLKQLFYSLGLLLLIEPVFALSELPPYHCPASTEIVSKDCYFLKAVTTQNNLTMEWTGQKSKAGLPVLFTGVYFLGGSYIACSYKDASGNYTEMSPFLAQYKAAGIKSGPWVGAGMAQECHSSDPTECVFLIKK